MEIDIDVLLEDLELVRFCPDVGPPDDLVLKPMADQIIPPT